MDTQRYFNALSSVIGKEHIGTGIGTYQEKTVHAVLKNYFEPYSDSQEQKIGGFIADIVGENGIIEIQTAGFDKLRRKLSCFLEVSRVTVVHPIPLNKWILYIDPKTGTISKKRKSPKVGSPYEIFPELYKIKPLLNDPNLRICIVMLDIEEYHSSSEIHSRKMYTRYDRIPISLCDEIYLDCKADWLCFIPSDLPSEYTSSEFAAKANISIDLSRLTLNILTKLGITERIGKKQNSYLYRTLLT